MRIKIHIVLIIIKPEAGAKMIVYMKLTTKLIARARMMPGIIRIYQLGFLNKA